MTELKNETISVDLTAEQIEVLYIIYIDLKESVGHSPILLSGLENIFKPIKEAWNEVLSCPYDEDDYI